MHKLVNTKKTIYKPNAFDTPHENTNRTFTALSHLLCLHNNNPLSLVPQSCRNLLLTTERPIATKNSQPSPISHMALQQSTIDVTYEQTIEQPHTLTFRSQNNNLFSI